MRDPYHNARLRFKVARDRFINDVLSRSFPCLHQNRPHSGKRREEAQREMWMNFTVDELVKQATLNVTAPLFLEAVEAAGILQTMLRFKITDERQALLLWKLSRD